MQTEILEALLHLSSDPIPNIRFNVAKSLEVLAITYGSTPEGKAIIQSKILPALHDLKNDTDADVRYFATHALQKAGGGDASGMLLLSESSSPRNVG